MSTPGGARPARRAALSMSRAARKTRFSSPLPRVLGPLPAGGEAVLSRYAPPLAAQYEQWRARAGVDSGAGMPYSASESARFVPIGANRELGAVIFIEDQTRVQAQARQLKLAALGRLTANIAHEIRNPLGAISHAAQLLVEDAKISEASRRLSDIIKANAERVSTIIGNVQQLARRESTRPERMPLAEWVADFVREFVSTGGHDAAQLAADTPDPELEVRVDPSHLRQILAGEPIEVRPPKPVAPPPAPPREVKGSEGERAGGILPPQVAPKPSTS